MKIEFEISDIERLSKALNNSLIAYSDICWAINLGLDPQVRASKFEKLKYVSKSELKAQISEMKSLYDQILNIERRMSNDS